MDIIVAVAIITKNYHFFGYIILVVILFGKGIFSFLSDTLGKIYGGFDIISAVLMLMAFAPFPLDVIVFVVLIYKGMISLI